MDLGIDLVTLQSQEVAESRMKETCTVTRLGDMVEDADDVEHPSEETIYSGKCEVRASSWSNDPRVSAGRPVEIQPYTVKFPVHTDVRPGDIVRVEGRQKPLYLHGSHDASYQSAVRMPASEEANADG